MKGKKFGEGVQESVARVMARKIGEGMALDVSLFPRLAERYYVMPPTFDPKQDFIDFERKLWIRSIGRLKTATGFPMNSGLDTLHVMPGMVLASTGTEFTAMPGVECVWQR